MNYLFNLGFAAFLFLSLFASTVCEATLQAQTGKSSTTPVDALPMPIGKVVWIKGNLTATMPNKEQRKLEKGSVIYLKDILQTKNDSEAQVVFTDNTLMTFRPNTKFFLDQYDFNPHSKQTSVGKYVMSLLEGGFRTITGLIAKQNPNDYQINTPVATIGVRGTEYEIVLQGGHLFMKYYKGTPCLRSKNGTSICLSASVPYAEVLGTGLSPASLNEEPNIFNEELPIISTSAPVFSGGGGGVISSFCITH